MKESRTSKLTEVVSSEQLTSLCESDTHYFNGPSYADGSDGNYADYSNAYEDHYTDCDPCNGGRS